MSACGPVPGLGARVCGRVVPDGLGHRFLGAIVDVPPGREQQLRRVLDRRDGRGLLDWVAAASGPPELLVDGDPPVHCRAVLRLAGDPTVALNTLYVPSELGWIVVAGVDEVHGLVELDGNELIATASTEARMDRLLAELTGALRGSDLVREERRPVRLRLPHDADQS